MVDSVNAMFSSSSSILSTSELCDDICSLLTRGMVLIDSFVLLTGAFSDIKGSSTCAVSVYN